MSERPKDIPQDTWDGSEARALEAAATALRNLEQDDFAVEVHAIRCSIARAIDAAKAEEREAILQFEFDVPAYRTGAETMIAIREYIRKRGEAQP